MGPINLLWKFVSPSAQFNNTYKGNNMNEEFLKQLRNIFRQDFEEHDYCIGQERVEQLFRKLLNEFNTPMEPHKGDPIYK
jgi:negative regulator of genetic competence, sporulation and motility